MNFSGTRASFGRRHFFSGDNFLFPRTPRLGGAAGGEDVMASSVETFKLTTQRGYPRVVRSPLGKHIKQLCIQTARPLFSQFQTMNASYVDGRLGKSRNYTTKKSTGNQKERLKKPHWSKRINESISDRSSNYIFLNRYPNS